jgi:hypothetical protein
MLVLVSAKKRTSSDKEVSLVSIYNPIMPKKIPMATTIEKPTRSFLRIFIFFPYNSIAVIFIFLASFVNTKKPAQKAGFN